MISLEHDLDSRYCGFAISVLIVKLLEGLPNISHLRTNIVLD